MRTERAIAPLLAGPIYTITFDLALSGVYQDSKIEVFGSTAGSMGSYPWKSETSDGYIHLDIAPLSGDTITALQTSSAGEVSYPYPLAYSQRVLDVPKILPVPTVLSPVHTCSSYITVGNLIPGATVQGNVGLNPFDPFVIDELALAPEQTVELNPSVTLPPGAVVTVWQYVRRDGNDHSLPGYSLPIEDLGLHNPLRKPKISPVPEGCDTSASVHELILGADLRLDNVPLWFEAYGVPEGDYVAESFTGGLGVPGESSDALTAFQYFPRCDLKSEVSTVYIPTPGPPDIPYALPFAENADAINFEKLSPGGDLTVRLWYTRPGNFDVFIGSMPIKSSNQAFPIPEPWKPLRDRSGVGKANLDFIQTSSCGIEGFQSSPNEPRPAPKIPKIYISGPMYECSTFVEVMGFEQSQSVYLVDEDHRRLSAPVSGNSSVVRVSTYAELKAGQNIYAVQQDVSGDTEWFSDKFTVSSLSLEGNNLTQPVITKSLQSGDQRLVVSNLLGGASVSVIVDGSLFYKGEVMWNKTFHATHPEETIFLARPLSTGQSVLVVQKLCQFSSSLEGEKNSVEGPNLFIQEGV
ncbi:hypothetical protein IQ07DRAFT_650059 [Pyrenochaeta sp. DS3sAY3a]|nr:hypothetical protein IQ07DRAFT_650059 [Pyrenochaeta sp. DS3sAY3a]